MAVEKCEILRQRLVNSLPNPLRWRLVPDILERRRGAPGVAEIGELRCTDDKQAGKVFVRRKVVQYRQRVRAHQCKLYRPPASEFLPGGEIGVKKNPRVSDNHQ